MFSQFSHQILVIFSIAAIGAITRYRGFLKEETIIDLTKVTLNVLIPSLIFYSTLTQLNVDSLIKSWYLPFFGMFTILFSCLLGFIVSKFLKIENKALKHTFIYLSTFHDYTYISIPLVYGFFKEKGLALLFLHNFGCTLLFWSLGIWILNTEKKVTFLRSISSPSFITIFIAIIIIVLKLNTSIPTVLTDALRLLGQATVPIVMLSIGSILIKSNFSKYIKSKYILCIILLRLIIVPCCIYSLLTFLNMPHMIKNIVVLISSMPCTSSSPIMTTIYGGDRELALSAVFITTLLSLITVPCLAALFFSY